MAILIEWWTHSVVHTTFRKTAARGLTNAGVKDIHLFHGPAVHWLSLPVGVLKDHLSG